MSEEPARQLDAAPLDVKEIGRHIKARIAPGYVPLDLRFDPASEVGSSVAAQ